MMEKNEMKLFGIDKAILFIESSIEDNMKNIVINTIFGKIFVDTDYKNFDPGTSVIIEEWDITGPKNPCFDISGIKNDVDYYICICNPSSKLRLHLLCIEAVYRLVFRSMCKIDLDIDAINAILIMHSYRKDRQSLTPVMLYEDFLEHNVGRFIKKNDMVQWLVRDHFESMIRFGKDILDRSNKLFIQESKKGNCSSISNSEYDEELYGIMLYISEKYGVNIHNKLVDMIFGK